MKHADYEDLLLAELTGSLRDPGERQRLAAHLKTCSRCRALRHEWQLIASAVRSTRPVYTRKGYPMRIALTPHHTPRRVSLTALVALAAALLVITALLLMPKNPSSHLSSGGSGIEQSQETSSEYSWIYLAVRPISMGTQLSESDVIQVEYPREMVSPISFRSLDNLIGRYATTNIPCGVPLLISYTSDEVVSPDDSYVLIDNSYICSGSIPQRIESVDLVEILSVRGSFPRGALLGDYVLESVQLPSILVPSGAIPANQAALLEGALVLTDLQSQQILMRNMFNTNAMVATFGDVSESQDSDFQSVDIVVAARPIENGAVITDEDVEMLRFPADYAPFDSLAREEDVIGTIARYNIACGLPILQNQLATNANEVPLGQPMLSTDYDCPNGLPPLTEPVDTVEIWIAVVATIPRGAQITEIPVQARRFPAALVPEGALLVSDIDVVGLYTQQQIEREQVLMRDMVSGEEPDCLLFTVDHIMQPCSTAFIDGNAITATPVPSATMTATSTIVPTATP